MLKENSAGAVVFRREKEIKYLILHYQAGHWGLPKGHIEEGESPKKAAQREIKEETGIEKIRFLERFKEHTYYYYTKNKKTRYKEVVYFVAHTKEKKITLSEEHLDFDWLNYEEACEKVTYQNVKNILTKANNFINQIYF